jgi:hypothetical protein
MRYVGLRLPFGSYWVCRTFWNRIRDVGGKLTKNKPSRQDEPFNHDLARYVADFHKHLTTLSTGALVFLFSLIDKLFHAPQWKLLIVATMVGFLSTIVCCVFSYALYLSSVENNRNLELRQKRLDDLLGLCMLLSFTERLVVSSSSSSAIMFLPKVILIHRGGIYKDR